DRLTRYQFHLEAEFLLNTRHANLLRGYAVFEQAGRLYLVMDYVDGHTLEEIAIDHIRRTGAPLPEASILDWVIPVCGALHTLHTSPVPIIHRDVKPANIKITRHGVPILIDLGLAKLYAHGQQTIAAALAFTPGYAPPEQYQAVGATDQRTDVYGLGATLYYLLTGYQPVEAPARISAQALPTPLDRNPTLSPRVDAMVLRAMALDPTQRFQTVKELERELNACRADLLAAPPSIESAQPRICARCGGSSPAEARFCMRCGHALWVEPWQTAPVAAIAPLAAPPLPAPPLPAAPAANARLTQPPASVWPARPAHRGALAGLGAAAFAAPPELWRGPRWLTTLDEAPPATAQEAQVSLAAALAIVCVALSLMAPFHPLMLAFAAPGLGLGVWSSVHLGETNAPREFHWLAIGALILGSLWLLVLLLHFALTLR
ncbi:MAG: protein kinase, partial [Chloroflexota bacterium]|nr:protein kinase [Chloroflexota bacterium]